MLNTKESIRPIKILAGETGGTVEFTPPNGHVIGCVIYYPEIMPNQGIVRASIKDVAQQPISEMQDIRNYRSRDCEYLKGVKPLNLMANGSTYTFTIAAKLPMDNDFEADLIFVYAPENNNCANQQ